MADIVIKAENLGKRYTIGHQTGRGNGRTFREALIQNTADLWNKTRDLARGKPIIQGDTQEEVWALKDVSFEIRRGEAVGIIGRNGAGKSTLLKILSRITEPTTGRVTIKGRVASLLEVGTGFHSELSGRENIYLNGAILGMTRAEIKRKFDEIVAFAEVEKYLDTPVKRYSSGMYIRLAFAVAAHLEPEILLVDEVLAVGDAIFQKKCLGKMETIANKGRTVLFVSHNIAAIEALCSRCLMLSTGTLAFIGTTTEVTEKYLNKYTSPDSISIKDRKDRQGIGNIKIIKIEISAPHGIATGKSINIIASYESKNNTDIREFGLSIWTSREVKLISLSTEFLGGLNNIPRQGIISCEIPELPLVKGHYMLNYFISSFEGIEDYIVNALPFFVEDSNFFGTGKSVDPNWGVIAVRHRWYLKDSI